MEKMDSNRFCQHPIKVYSTNGFVAKLSDPPVMEVPYICKDCGKEGIDLRTPKAESTQYNELKAKKANGGFK